jgi:hypothetical protein
MRTSLNKIQKIEAFLTEGIAPEERVLFEASQLLDHNLAEDVILQREAYAIISAYGRAQLKTELNLLHHKLLTDPSKKTFWDLILTIFQKH